MKLTEKRGGGEVITLPSGFPSRHLPFSSKLLIPAFTGKKMSNFGQNLTPRVKWQISSRLLANREPVGKIRAPVGKIRAPVGKCQKSTKNSKKKAKICIFEHFHHFSIFQHLAVHRPAPPQAHVLSQLRAGQIR